MGLNSAIRSNIRQILFVTASFTLMIILSCFFMNRVVRAEVGVAAQEMLSKTEANVYSIFREFEVATLAISASIRDRLDSGQSVGSVDAYITNLNREMTYTKERVTGLVSVGGFIQGKLNADAGWTPPRGYSPEDRPWYVSAREANGGVAFTGPYTDMRTGDRVISFSKSIRGKNGEDYGVIFLYMCLDVLWDNVASLKFENGGYGMIADERGRIVIHPDKNLEGEPLSAANAGYARVADRIRAKTDPVSDTDIINFSEGDVISFFQRITNGWYVGVAFPSDGYYGDVYFMTAVLTALGTIMMLTLSWLLLRLSMEKQHSDEENAGKSSFLAKMSHEIRTPLNSILGMSELIMRKDVPREIFEYISIIRQSGNSLLTIINDILDFSKMEAGQLEICFEKYCFASLINDVINVIRVRLIDKPVVFVVKVDSGIPSHLVGDETRVRQILLNLLGNAVKYTDTGHIALDVMMGEAGNDGVRLIFRIEDSGVGIKPCDMNKLFRDFTRISASHNHAVEGTGLGLAISRGLCLSMGGDISVTSEYMLGSVFTAEILQTRGSEKKLAAVDDAAMKRVLVMEERPICLDAIVYAMTGLGVKPVCARNLAEFNRALESGGYDFAFIPSQHAAGCMFTLSGGKSATKLVSMVELGEVSSYGDAHSVMTPIFCASVANILNNTAKHARPCDDARRVHFLAPDVKALIVDDILTNLRVSKELMALYGMDIHTCLSGVEAIELVRVNRYDIVFMDHMMPDMDGVETAAAIRAIDGGDSYYQKLPIIALTANVMSGQREMFLRNGMNGFLAKPIEMRKLDETLREWIPEERRVNPGAAANKAPSRGPDEPFEIEGVSTETGLRNSGGSVAAYANILMDFCRDAKERAQQIKQCLADDNISLYLTLVHALKGASRAVGAAEFAEFAERMEDVAQCENMEVIAKMTDKMLTALQRLIEEIRDALEDRFAAGDARAAEESSVPRLETLKSALSDMDIATVNDLMLEYAGISFDVRTSNELFEIERLILLFEYDAAIKRIDNLINAAAKYAP